MRRDERLTQKANAYIDEILRDLDEDTLADIIEKRASARLNDAILLLRSTPWWVKTLRDSLDRSNKKDTVILSKLIDKIIPTPKAKELDEGEGFILQVEHLYPKGEEINANGKTAD